MKLGKLLKNKYNNVNMNKRNNFKFMKYIRIVAACYFK